jgi:hypothetical protein
VLFSWAGIHISKRSPNVGKWLCYKNRSKKRTLSSCVHLPNSWTSGGVRFSRRIRSVSVCKKKGATAVHPLYYMLEKQLGAEGRSPTVLALGVIDGHVWSASSGLAVAEWRLARERGTDQRRIEMSQSIQLDAGALGKRSLLGAMCRVSQQQVWLAVDHQLVPLELSFDRVMQKVAVCTIDADLCNSSVSSRPVWSLAAGIAHCP